MSISNPRIPALVTMRQVVMSYLNRKGIYNLINYKRFIQIAIECFSEELAIFDLDIGLEVVYLKMSEAKTVNLPSDFVDYSKIGVPINGKLRVLTRHDQILLPRTFFNSLTQIASQFVTNHAATYLAAGVIVTSSGTSIIMTAETAGVDFTGDTTITNTAGDLTGTVVHTTPNGPGVQRVDTITLSGTYGTANILCSTVTQEASFDSGEAVGNTDTGDSEGSIDIVFFTDHFRKGQFVGGLYGLPGGIDDAYYRVDMDNRQIIFSGSVPRSEIVLEYITSGLKADGTSLIPRQAVPSLRAYIDWVAVENDPRMSQAEKNRKKALYDEAETKLRSFELALTGDELKRAIWSALRQSPKR